MVTIVEVTMSYSGTATQLTKFTVGSSILWLRDQQMKRPCKEAKTEHSSSCHKTVMHTVISVLDEVIDCITYVDWVGVSSNPSVN